MGNLQQLSRVETPFGEPLYGVARRFGHISKDQCAGIGDSVRAIGIRISSRETLLPSDNRMARTTAWSGIMLLGAIFFVIAARAAEAPPVLPSQLVGNTLSAVVYVPRPAGAAGGGALQRVMLQVYFAADGSTLLRQWNGARNSYTALVRTRWSLSANRLCIEMPSEAPGGLAKATICAAIHIWWPRIAGIGTQPYALLNGDLRHGNALADRARMSTPR